MPTSVGASATPGRSVIIAPSRSCRRLSGLEPHLPVEDMSQILTLRGAAAHSASRLERLQATIAKVLPKLAAIHADRKSVV